LGFRSCASVTDAIRVSGNPLQSVERKAAA
jgi:hypothetical protein